MRGVQWVSWGRMSLMRECEEIQGSGVQLSGRGGTISVLASPSGVSGWSWARGYRESLALGRRWWDLNGPFGGISRAQDVDIPSEGREGGWRDP